MTHSTKDYRTPLIVGLSACLVAACGALFARITDDIDQTAATVAGMVTLVEVNRQQGQTNAQELRRLWVQVVK